MSVIQALRLNIQKLNKQHYQVSAWQKQEDIESLAQLYNPKQLSIKQKTTLRQLKTCDASPSSKLNPFKNIRRIKQSSINQIQNDKLYLQQCILRSLQNKQIFLRDSYHVPHVINCQDVWADDATYQSTPLPKFNQNIQNSQRDNVREENKNILFQKFNSQNKIKRRFLVRSKLPQDYTKKYIKRRQQIKIKQSKDNITTKIENQNKRSIQSVCKSRTPLAFPLFLREGRNQQKAGQIYNRRNHIKNKSSFNLTHISPPINSRQFIDDRIFILS